MPVLRLHGSECVHYADGRSVFLVRRGADGVQLAAVHQGRDGAQGRREGCVRALEATEAHLGRSSSADPARAAQDEERACGMSASNRLTTVVDRRRPPIPSRICATHGCDSLAFFDGYCRDCWDYIYSREYERGLEEARAERRREREAERAAARRNRKPLVEKGLERIGGWPLFIVIACAMGWFFFETFGFWVELFTGQRWTAVWGK
jgi:hypothetical protein